MFRYQPGVNMGTSMFSRLAENTEDFSQHGAMVSHPPPPRLVVLSVGNVSDSSETCFSPTQHCTLSVWVPCLEACLRKVG